MAADQRKKRLNATSIVGCNSRELYRAKRKKLRSVQYDLNMRSSISLEWDDRKMSVVAKKNQIGISGRDLIPFVDALPHCRNILADVVTVPREIFELENLTNVLSYEVWQTYLSEYERDLLTQFLPKGVQPHGGVQELLAGNNLHFGNPFLKWGASLCCGSLHPDAVLHQEERCRADKKAYYSFLQKYHNDMVVNLQMWKERWASCKDPEKEIVQKIWRSNRHVEKSMPTKANESRFPDPDEDLVATSESCSWAADEKACSSDNPNTVMMHREPQRRKGFVNDKYDNLSDGLKVLASHKKGEKLHKSNIQCGDGAKYMSYIKVSKEQHRRVKSSMKHFSNSIQPRSLNHVLGDLDALHVQPFEVFEEEERQKLHEHWLLLANRDLPAGFANWRKRHLQKRQLTVSLGQELRGKIFANEDEEENPDNMLPEKGDNITDHSAPTIMDEGEERSDSLLREQTDDGIEEHESAYALEAEQKENPDCLCEGQKDDKAARHEATIGDGNESGPASSENKQLQRNTLPIVSHELPCMELDSEGKHVIAKTDDVPYNVSECPENLKNGETLVSQGGPLSSDGDIWPAVSIPSSFYHSNVVSNGYASSSELSLGHPQVLEDQPTRLINLESDLRPLHGQSNDGSFFSSYSNQDRNELLQSFFKGQRILNYHEQKQTGLDFQPGANAMTETSQPPGCFRTQQHPSVSMELRQKILNELYMQQNIQENIYSDRGKYSIPGHEQYSSLNIQDWTANSMRMSTPFHSNMNGGELTQNWFCGEHRTHGGWSGSEGAVGPGQSVGDGSNADQSLFSILSQCNELRPGSSYDSLGSTGRFIHSGNYGGVDAGVPTASNILPQPANALNYLGGHEAAAELKANNIGWMGLKHQNPALQDPMSKSFFGSWHR